MLKQTLEIRNVSKMYNDKYVLRNINLNIYPGEIFGIIGPKGSGKTTLVRIITGMAKPTNGDVCVCGYSILKDFEQAMQNIGAAHRNSDMYNYMTAKQNISYYARLFPLLSPSRIDDVLEMVGLENKTNQLVKNFNSDQRQRLNLAQAILHNPKLVVLDDPTFGMNETTIVKMRQILKSMAIEQNVSVLITGHTLNEVELICDNVAFLDQGTIVETKTMNNIMQDISNDSKYRILVNYPNYSAKMIYLKYNVPVEVAGNSILIPYDDELLEEVKESLMVRDIQIYDIKEETKSLEDIYLDIMKLRNIKK